MVLGLPLKGDMNTFTSTGGEVLSPVQNKQALLPTFGQAFFRFLIFYIPTNFVGIKTDCIDAITACPKMISPVGFLFQITTFIKHTVQVFEPQIDERYYKGLGTRKETELTSCTLIFGSVPDTFSLRWTTLMLMNTI